MFSSVRGGRGASGKIIFDTEMFTILKVVQAAPSPEALGVFICRGETDVWFYCEKGGTRIHSLNVRYDEVKCDGFNAPEGQKPKKAM